MIDDFSAQDTDEPGSLRRSPGEFLEPAQAGEQRLLNQFFCHGAASNASDRVAKHHITVTIELGGWIGYRCAVEWRTTPSGFRTCHRVLRLPRRAVDVYTHDLPDRVDVRNGVTENEENQWACPPVGRWSSTRTGSVAGYRPRGHARATLTYGQFSGPDWLGKGGGG